MCYPKPGPRCSAHALERKNNALEALKSARKSDNEKAIASAEHTYEEALQEFYTTPAGFKEIEDKINASDNPELVQRMKSTLKRLRSERQAAIELVSDDNENYDEDDITTWIPSQVDTKAADILYDGYKIGAEVQRVKSRVEEYTRLSDPNYRYYNRFDAERYAGELERYQNELAQLQQKVQENKEEFRPYNEEFSNRGGWTRAFLVTNGHVHSSMNCSSCFPSTQYTWMTQFSGKTDDDVIDAAGERACTVCYPNAPVDVLSRSSHLRTPDEQAREDARVERERARVERETARAVKAISNPDGTPLRIGGRYGHTIATERTAQSEYVGESARLDYYRRVGGRQEMVERLELDIDSLSKALAHKRGISVDELHASLATKVATKIRKEYS